MSQPKITYSNLLDHKGDFGQGIEIFNQALNEVPKSILTNTKAIGLTLNRTKLSTLPNQLERLKKLERLDLSNNEFETLPEVVGELENLRYLNLSKNKLSSLPRDIMYLRKLEEIVLDNNLFEEFPEVLFQSLVEDVSLKKNKLKSVPPGIKSMEKLKILVVSDNQLKTLPIELTALPQLTELFAASNQIKALPENFCTSAKSLKKLNLLNNPLVYPSAVSAAKGVAAVRDYEKKHPRPDIPPDEEELQEDEQPREEAPKENDKNVEQPPESTLNGDAQEEERMVDAEVNGIKEAESSLNASPVQDQNTDDKESELPECEQEEANQYEDAVVDNEASIDIAQESVPEPGEKQPEDVASEEVPEATTESQEHTSSPNAEPDVDDAVDPDADDERLSEDGDGETQQQEGSTCGSVKDDDTGEVSSIPCGSNQPEVDQAVALAAEGDANINSLQDSQFAPEEPAPEADQEATTSIDNDMKEDVQDISSTVQDNAAEIDQSTMPESSEDSGTIGPKYSSPTANELAEAPDVSKAPEEDKPSSAAEQQESQKEPSAAGENGSPTEVGDENNINERLI